MGESNVQKYLLLQYRQNRRKIICEKITVCFGPLLVCVHFVRFELLFDGLTV